MTLKDIQDRLREIRELSDDPEAAHSEEDQLHRDVLKAISKHKCSSPELCAREALKSQEIPFPRWFA